MRTEGSANERRRSGLPGGLYKARTLNARPECEFFVESHDHHAELIAQNTKKTVISVESWRSWNAR